MKYNIKAHKTKYAGVRFRSRLEAQWAAFFDLAGIKWEYEPIDLDGWVPDFRIEIPDADTEGSPCLVLLVEVKPYFDIADFDGHDCTKYEFGHRLKDDGRCDQIPAHASACFGANPSTTSFCIVRGDGGGYYGIGFYVDNADHLWKRAGSVVQWTPKRK